MPWRVPAIVTQVWLDRGIKQQTTPFIHHQIYLLAHSIITEEARKMALDGRTCTRSSSFLSSRRCTWHRRPSVICGRRQTVVMGNLGDRWRSQRSVGWIPPGTILWLRLPSLGVGHVMPRRGWTVGHSRKHLWSPFCVPTGLMKLVRQWHTGGIWAFRCF